MAKSSEEYWIERVREANEQILKQTEKMAQRKLIIAYKKAYEDLISKEIASLYAEYANKEGEISYTKLLKYDRLKKMAANFKKIAEDLGAGEIKFCDDTFPEIYKEACKNVSEPLGIDWSIVPKEQINRSVNYPWSGSHYSDNIWNNKVKLVNNLKQIVTQGVIQGKSISTMMNELRGAMEKGAYECRRIVRTETMHMVNAGSIDSYKAAGVTELEYVMSQDYYANGKPRYCEVCAADKGRIFELEKAPILPRHPNCRCTYVPVIETMKAPGGEKKQDPVKKAPDKKQKTIMDMNFEELEKKAKKLNMFFNDEDSYYTLKNTDIRFIRQAVAFVDKMQSKYPQLNKYPLYLCEKNYKGGVNGACNEYGEIFFNINKFGETEYYEMLEEETIRKRGWHSYTTNSVNSTFAHEYGHYISTLIKKGYKGKSWDDVVRMVRNEAAKEYKKATGEKILVKDIGEYVSEYGASSAHETFAEVFQEVYNSDMKMSNEYTKAYKKIIERELEKL